VRNTTIVAGGSRYFACYEGSQAMPSRLSGKLRL
jgi:hypothetical protein